LSSQLREPVGPEVALTPPAPLVALTPETVEMRETPPRVEGVPGLEVPLIGQLVRSPGYVLQ
jgi:hypothetical protein